MKNRKTLVYCLTMLISFVVATALAHGGSNLDFNKGDEWRYFKGTTEPPLKWNAVGFDDSAWLKGRSGFGYGTDKPNTMLDDMKGSYSTIYVRREFIVPDYHDLDSITLSVVCDGPFAAYLNGVEAIRSGKPQYGEPLNLTGWAHELDTYRTVIAIRCSNDNINSKDYSFIPVFHIHYK